MIYPGKVPRGIVLTGANIHRPLLARILAQQLNP